MTYLKAFSRCILEKQGIVTGFFVCRPLDVASACCFDNFSQPVHLTRAGCPKSDAALIGDMILGLCHAEEFGHPGIPALFILNPTFNPGVAIETKWGQKRLIE